MPYVPDALTSGSSYFSDFLRSIRQYDGKLSNVLQRFQVRCLFITGVPSTHHLEAEIGLNTHFAQLVERLKVQTLPF